MEMKRVIILIKYSPDVQYVNTVWPKVEEGFNSGKFARELEHDFGIVKPSFSCSLKNPGFGVYRVSAVLSFHLPKREIEGNDFQTLIEACKTDFLNSEMNTIPGVRNAEVDIRT